MILTYKLKHGRNFANELNLAKKVAAFAIRTKSNTSKDVKHIGLPSAISNQILRKYRKKGIKKISNIKLTIPGQSIKMNSGVELTVPCLNLNLTCQQIPKFDYIKQIEIGQVFAYLTISIPNQAGRLALRYIGVDCNATGHIAVAAIPHTGKVWKLGKHASHIRQKYKNIRKRLQKQGKYQLLMQIKHRESNIMRNLNHNISKKLVQIAASEKCGIKFERLRGIRNNKIHQKSFRYSLNSWSYYQLQKFTEYKARSQGIEVVYVAPAYTSKSCSICGSLGNRKGKKFQCVRCGHADHADVNASFNIGNPVLCCAIVPAVYMPPQARSMSQLYAESDACKGSTDTPLCQKHYNAEILKMAETVKPIL